MLLGNHLTARLFLLIYMKYKSAFFVNFIILGPIYNLLKITHPTGMGGMLIYLHKMLMFCKGGMILMTV